MVTVNIKRFVVERLNVNDVTNPSRLSEKSAVSRNYVPRAKALLKCVEALEPLWYIPRRHTHRYITVEAYRVRSFQSVRSRVDRSSISGTRL
jgi:hypothetical protein